MAPKVKVLINPVSLRDGERGTGLLVDLDYFILYAVLGLLLHGVGTGTRLQRVRLLALLGLCKRPWSLRGPRGYAPMGADGWDRSLLYAVHRILSLSVSP